MSLVLSALARAPMASVPDVNVTGELIRVLLSLGGIVALIFAAGWLTKRLQSRQLIGGRRLRCVESMSISARERVLLIEADGKRLLVGVGAGGVRALHVYEGTVSAEEPQAPVVPPFAELLGRWRRNG
ncbi:flagellar biosynthetic protein FliO [Dyella psychrodurans]|uniref:Flagellar protein n=1 Tax=Dyella psychrodurans TaxID=1927960 RepID=A0A370X098_9GAMM|nr:flagellar biosynthetic protein FliO [Dyella psychrodurans]RDS81843.1 flagellar biosynthetic protein FliO [Dyella psychrodurans]